MGLAGQILIIDDEQSLRALFKRVISLEGYTVLEAWNSSSARDILEKQEIDVVLCDVLLPDGNGVDLVREIHTEYPGTEVILFTGHANIGDGVKAMKYGAFDYLIKGDDNEKLLPLMSRAVEKVHLQKRIINLEKKQKALFGFDNIIGKSAAIKGSISLAKKIAKSDLTVLLTGETGTGKEVFAKAIYAESKRVDRPYVAINCSAFSKELLESQLFGHKAGAFTGASHDHNGLLEQANGGTLFLDEIGEMGLDLQAKLLRVLEEREYLKVGDTQSKKIDIRVISATNRDLSKEVEEGRFREDLFYRLNVFPIQLPSLFERKSDIPMLARYFVDFYSKKMNKTVSNISHDLMEQLIHYPWCGNIRELKNLMERAVIMCDGTDLNPGHLPSDFQRLQHINAERSALYLTSVEKTHIQKVLAYTRGNKTEAAKLLEIGLATLYRKIETYDIN